MVIHRPARETVRRLFWNRPIGHKGKRDVKGIPCFSPNGLAANRPIDLCRVQTAFANQLCAARKSPLGEKESRASALVKSRGIVYETGRFSRRFIALATARLQAPRKSLRPSRDRFKRISIASNCRVTTYVALANRARNSHAIPQRRVRAR